MSIFFAKQVQFHLASRVSKFIIKTRNKEVSKARGNDNRKNTTTRSGLLSRPERGFRREPEEESDGNQNSENWREEGNRLG